MTQHTPADPAGQTALVTGAGRRIGAALARALHGCGANVVIHCRRSRAEADALAAELEAERPGSTRVVAADLREPAECERLVAAATDAWGGLGIVVNNASTFYPTPVGTLEPSQFDDLVGSNLRAPAFVAQAAAPALRAAGGSIVNIADIHGLRPLDGHAVYCAAKAGLVMLTRALARELAPGVRVNAIAPGSILWPEGPRGDDPDTRAAVLAATPLERQGTPGDIAAALLYLVRDAGVRHRRGAQRGRRAGALSRDDAADPALRARRRARPRARLPRRRPARRRAGLLGRRGGGLGRARG
ncbi:MAG: pteridine reductase [Halofilum sp. (in: g-proteobacteria)]|nr:pteridine reductase [Halofilum sp. (in: g-proteobacteria)]